MVKRLKYQVRDESNNILHWSYTKQKAENWIKKNKKGFIHKIEQVNKDKKYIKIRWKDKVVLSKSKS